MISPTLDASQKDFSGYKAKAARRWNILLSSIHFNLMKARLYVCIIIVVFNSIMFRNMKFT